MNKFLISICSIALSTVVTWFYFGYFGFNLKSIIVFYIGIEYIKLFINWKKNGEAK